MNKDIYLYGAILMFVASIFYASESVTFSATISAIGAALSFLIYKSKQP